MLLRLLAVAAAFANFASSYTVGSVTRGVDSGGIDGGGSVFVCVWGGEGVWNSQGGNN